MFNVNKVLIFVMFFFVGCASVNRSELSSDDPNKAITEVQLLRDNAKKSQYDLLADDQFQKGNKALERAISDHKDEGDRNETLLKLAEAKAYFNEAKTVADNRATIPTRVLAARKATLDNGVWEDKDQIQRLLAIDHSVKNKTKNFSKNLEVDDLSEFEQTYLKLEIDSVQNMQLRVIRDVILNADKNNAQKIAPKTYTDALNQLHAAENMIQQSPRNPENFKASVTASNASATLLYDVMNKLQGVASGAPETAALELVSQDRKLGKLSDRAGNLQGLLSKSQTNLKDVNSELKAKTDEALISSNKVLDQKAIDDMRKLFSEEEADVYQQGSNVIIRMKKIDFGSGSAMIPSESMSLLSKVNSVIVNLQSSNVVVEGHTDSTGSEDRNKNLSIKRSEAVASYLKSLGSNYEILSEGYGAAKPIANNETTEGRAMNRRVDIIVNTVK